MREQDETMTVDREGTASSSAQESEVSYDMGLCLEDTFTRVVGIIQIDGGRVKRLWPAESHGCGVAHAIV